jgi:hypothetical protein
VAFNTNFIWRRTGSHDVVQAGLEFVIVLP